jgi:aerobic-type carbon monoxide dehydrogenase small subunit (CoxS/CutS family)|tara:strand:+ start:342 stop:857 length:516 start_codon:yes stop_codon:yes gene_type:complete
MTSVGSTSNVERPRKSTSEIEVTVNGVREHLVVSNRKLLSDVLRDDLGLTGTHVGCEHGVCGACTVIVDDLAVRSCLMFAVQADGSTVTTVEGLAQDGKWSSMQTAFNEHHGLQCGFCTAGFLMTLSKAEPADYETDAEIRELLSGNLCRCTGYHNIVVAVKAAWGRGATE